MLNTSALSTSAVSTTQRLAQAFGPGLRKGKDKGGLGELARFFVRGKSEGRELDGKSGRGELFGKGEAGGEGEKWEDVGGGLAGRGESGFFKSLKEISEESRPKGGSVWKKFAKLTREIREPEYFKSKREKSEYCKTKREKSIEKEFLRKPVKRTSGSLGVRPKKPRLSTSSVCDRAELTDFVKGALQPRDLNHSELSVDKKIDNRIIITDPTPSRLSKTERPSFVSTWDRSKMKEVHKAISSKKPPMLQDSSEDFRYRPRVFKPTSNRHKPLGKNFDAKKHDMSMVKQYSSDPNELYMNTRPKSVLSLPKSRHVRDNGQKSEFKIKVSPTAIDQGDGCVIENLGDQIQTNSGAKRDDFDGEVLSVCLMEDRESVEE